MTGLNPASLPPSLRKAIDEAVVTGDIPEPFVGDPRPLEELIRRIDAFNCEHSLAYFIRRAWPIIEPGRPLQWNWHIDTLCAYIEAVESGQITRLLLNIPPRSMKSSITSVFYPVWAWTRNPAKQFLTLSHEQGLALRDSLKSRNIIESPWFRERWPDLRLSGDQNEKAYYSNNANGHRNARGILSGMTGRGGDVLILDDPQDAEKAQSDVERQNVLDAFDNKLTSRLNDQSTGAIIIVQQRLHQLDLTGHCLAKEGQSWTHLAIPMEYDAPRFDAARDIGRPELNDPRRQVGELLWPERFPRKAVESLRIDLGSYGFAGQMQQDPSPRGGGILRKKWWRPWPQSKPLPPCEHLFSSWDTAFSTKDLQSVAYSARTDWGVFYDEQTDRYDLLLIDAWWGRVDYPELRRLALELARDPAKDYDRQLIERKASGQSLIQDLRRAQVRVYPYNPDRDKVSRAYAVQAMLEAGQVWYPEGRRWATQVIESVATFPNGAPPSADLTDTVTQALLYLRNNWWISAHPDDIDEEEDALADVASPAPLPPAIVRR